MKKINKKGFTLVELMAVLVILIIIIFIAINKVNQSVDESENKTIVANANIYNKAISDFMSVESLTNANYLNGNYTVRELNQLGVKISGTKPDNGQVYIVNAEVSFSCLEYGDKYIINTAGKVSEPVEGSCPKTSDFDFNYSGKSREFKAPVSAYYKIELWGAQGMDYNADTPGGKGAYTAGTIYLKKGEKVYLYIGGKGVNKTPGYNGGSAPGTTTDGTYYAGGGATDVRLESGEWNNFDSLKSRIMVAAGGAGSGYYSGVIKGGAGGALVGLSGTQSGSGAAHTVATGGTQTSPGLSVNGVAGGSAFGYAGQTQSYGTGGGGGYYGGGSGHCTSYKVSAGAGGSSFISGHPGCDAITESSTSSNIVHTGSPNHYSNKVFVDTVMIDGSSSMPTYDGTSTMVGNVGNGHAKIFFATDYVLHKPSKDPDEDYKEFEYTGKEQTYIAPSDGDYRLEVWGAQGGSTIYSTFNNTGGYGGYATGVIHLNTGDKLYINVGGKGVDVTYPQSSGISIFDSSTGYNGGGYGGNYTNNSTHGGGGGATSIATSTGLLSTLSSNTSSIIIVAGGGGAAATHASYPSYSANGGYGGGYVGGPGVPSNTTCYHYGTGGSQTAGGGIQACSSGGRTSRDEEVSTGVGFGKGSNYTKNNTDGRYAYSGGGGGYYGGQSGYHSGGGGGSGYIANEDLTDKSMYCYNCQESSDEDTKTISTTCYDFKARENCSKKGNGYAIIELLD